MQIYMSHRFNGACIKPQGGATCSDPDDTSLILSSLLLPVKHWLFSSLKIQPAHIRIYSEPVMCYNGIIGFYDVTLCGSSTIVDARV